MDIQYQAVHRDYTKREFKADWIQKEKLTLLETKEDKKLKERTQGQKASQQSESRQGLNLSEQEQGLIGFGAKASSGKG